MDIRTLQYWHKLEHFYPYNLQPTRNENVTTKLIGAQNSFPDFQDPSILPERRVRGYCVYLGIFRVEPAMRALEAGIGREMRFRDCGNDESCFCMFRLTPEGIIRPETFHISSFPWAIHRVRDGKIRIDQWDEDFLAFQRSFFSMLSQRETPVDLPFLQELRDSFASQINWEIEYSDNWLRIDQIIGKRAPESRADEERTQQAAQDGQEVSGSEEDIQAEDDLTDDQVKQNDLLNSFYARDLERVIDGVRDGKYGEAFRGFLEHRRTSRTDIEQDSDAMFALMSPANLPLGRWPSSYGARLMQQVDVNAFLTEDDTYRQSLFSVNGPPGTGKTTLLKDVVAAIVTKRACAMLELERPNDAFLSEAIGTIEYRGYRNRVWGLRPEWKRYGILVASNNNNAVENITLTLPMRKELPSQYGNGDFDYFREVSDSLLGQGQTWGLSAAALGKKSNQEKFIKCFWPIGTDEGRDFNFRKHLQSTTRNDSQERWEEAKQRFSAALDAIKKEYALIQAAYSDAAELRRWRRELPAIEAELPRLQMKMASLADNLRKQKDALAQVDAKQKELEEEIRYLQSTTPFLRLRELLSSNHPAVSEFRKRKQERSETKEVALAWLRKIEQTQKEFNATKQTAEEKGDRLRIGRQRIQVLRGKLEAFREETGSPFCVDEYFEDCGRGEHGKSSPWGYPRLNELRERLFLEGLQLQKAFVEGSSYLKDDLDSFGKLTRGMLSTSQTAQLTAPLLQSLFMVVPVISTTFASVGSFLRHVPAQEIAYLFIDEAGQAVPQCAAGAIWRARKVIAVGDPLQIEPVVTLHDGVVELLGRHFGQEEILMDKYSSVQTLADLANCLGAYRQITEPNDLWIGAPLTVHSRCQRTVFEIANRIAYNDKMIFATREQPDAICRWINVRGISVNGHYVPAQAEATLELMVDEFSAYAKQKQDAEKYPSLFVITPFRSARAGLVAFYKQELPRRLTDTGVMNPTLKKALQKWLQECVGTIHTFQGREADTVFLCLGVDSNGKGAGAVDWAGERPNILNVAVTRAKKRLYIVADSEVWCRKAYYKIAWEMCSKEGSDGL